MYLQSRALYYKSTVNGSHAVAVAVSALATKEQRRIQIPESQPPGTPAVRTLWNEHRSVRYVVVVASDDLPS